MNDHVEYWLAEREEWKVLHAVSRYPFPIRSAAQMLEIRHCSAELARRMKEELEPALLANAELMWSAAPSDISDIRHPHEQLVKSPMPSSNQAESAVMSAAPKVNRRECMPIQNRSVRKCRPQDFLAHHGTAPKTTVESAVNVIIDSRERGVHGCAAAFSAAVVDDNITSCTEMLPVGDIVFVQPAEKIIPLVIERKSRSDLASSIVDSRYRLQKRAMRRFFGTSAAENAVVRRIYLVQEEESWANVEPSKKSRVETALLTTGIIDGFTVIYAASSQQAVNAVRGLAKNLPCELRVSDISLGAWRAMHKEMSDDLDYDTVFLRQLRTIRGVSHEMAVRLAQRYRSMLELYAALHDASDPEAALVSAAVSKTSAQAIGACFSLHNVILGSY